MPICSEMTESLGFLEKSHILSTLGLSLYSDSWIRPIQQFHPLNKYIHYSSADLGLHIRITIDTYYLLQLLNSRTLSNQD